MDIKAKNHMITSIAIERVFEKIQHVIIKSLENVGLKKTHLNVIIAIHGKPTANIILNKEKLEAIPLKVKNKIGCLFPIPC